MPRRATMDGGHTVFTDHRIQARPRSDPSPARAPASLRPWRESVHDRRNLGLAQIAAGIRWESADLVQAGFGQLAPRQHEFERDPEVLGALGWVLMSKGRGEALPLLARAVSLAPRDVKHRLNLAYALAATGRRDAADRAFRELRELDPTIRIPPAVALR
jgi:tetratricopeptide (TPR) repeat protein